MLSAAGRNALRLVRSEPPITHSLGRSRFPRAQLLRPTIGLPAAARCVIEGEESGGDDPCGDRHTACRAPWTPLGGVQSAALCAGVHFLSCKLPVYVLAIARAQLSVFLDRGSDGVLGTAHTDHSSMIAFLKGFDSPLFRRHFFSPWSGPLQPGN